VLDYRTVSPSDARRRYELGVCCLSLCLWEPNGREHTVSSHSIDTRAMDAIDLTEDVREEMRAQQPTHCHADATYGDADDDHANVGGGGKAEIAAIDRALAEGSDELEEVGP